METPHYLITFFFAVLTCIALYNCLWYRSACFQMAADWMIADVIQAKETVDILVQHNVSNEVINIFKEQYRCASLDLPTNLIQSLDSTPVSLNVESQDS